MNSHLLNIEQRRSSLLRIVQLLTAIPVNLFLLVTLNNVNDFFGIRGFLSLSGFSAILFFTVLAILAAFLLFFRKKTGFLIGFFAFLAVSCCFAYSFNDD